MMKKILSILLFLTATNGFAQHKIITKYFDSVWAPAVPDKAKYLQELEPQDSFYIGTTYYFPSKKLYSKFYCLDSIARHQKKFGMELHYYESGSLKDSIYYRKPGQEYFEYSFYERGNKKSITRYGKDWGVYDQYVYYENGKLWAHNNRQASNQPVESIAFDSIGNMIPDYVYEKPAEFPGGIAGWTRYLERNLNMDLPVKNGAPVGQYTVYVSFTIDKEGNVSSVTAEENPGYGTMEEAIRVIRRGPKWKPAIQYNKPVVYRHLQGITFQVSN